MSRRSVRGPLLALVSVAIAAALVAGFLAAGKPHTERERKLDAVRVDALRGLSQAVWNHRLRNGALPPSLGALTPPGGRPYPATDPVRLETYGYAALDDSTYELCATFDQPSELDPARTVHDPWAHSAGRRCFRFHVERHGAGDPFLESEPAGP